MEKRPFLPGFRFHPTDVELVCFYLKRKIYGRPVKPVVISELDIYKFAPWDLPGKSCLQNGDLEWYFFCPRDRKYANGPRTNRATECGYWKTTGKDRPICNNSRVVGMKRTLVFHMGKAPHGDRSNWVMHEYRLEDENMVKSVVQQDAFVLCRIFEKSGPGPRNGEQYGAPFKEEDWNESFMENLTEENPSENFPAPSSTSIQATVSLDGASAVPYEKSASQENPSVDYDNIDKLLLELVTEGGNSSDEPAPRGNTSDHIEGLNNLMESALEDTELITSDVYFGLEDIPCQMNLPGVQTIHDFNFLHPALEGQPDLCHPFDRFIMDGSFLELNDLQYPMNVQTSGNNSCICVVPQASLSSFTNTRDVHTPSLAGTTSDAADDHCLFKDQVLEGSCADAHQGKGAVVVIKESFTSSDHLLDERDKVNAFTSAMGEGRDGQNYANIAFNGRRSVSILENLLDCYPARPALASGHGLASKGRILNGNLLTHSCLNSLTMEIDHVGVEVGSPCIHCCNSVKDTQRAKLVRKVGTSSAMPWRGFLFILCVSFSSAVMWILLLVLAFKFFRCIWKLNSYFPKF